jgi:hypothetical protein
MDKTCFSNTPTFYKTDRAIYLTGVNKTVRSICKEIGGVHQYNSALRFARCRHTSIDTALKKTYPWVYEALIDYAVKNDPAHCLNGIKMSVLNYAKKGEYKYQIKTDKECLGFNDRNEFIEWIEANI